MGRKGVTKSVQKIDPEFRYLIDIDPDLEEWRKLGAEWWRLNDKADAGSPLSRFFSEYIHKLNLPTRPEVLLDPAFVVPPLDKAFHFDMMVASRAARINDIIFDFIDWVLKEKFVQADSAQAFLSSSHLRNPFQRIQTKKIALDDEFMFLLNLNPRFVAWRLLAVEWCGLRSGTMRRSAKQSLARFFRDYLHSQGLGYAPEELLNVACVLPPMSDALKPLAVGGENGTRIHDEISDFVEWILKEKMAAVDANGLKHVPTSLRNPFPRIRTRIVRKMDDVELSYLLNADARMADWRGLAHEWLSSQTVNFAGKHRALDMFLMEYIIGQRIDPNPYTFLRRDYPKPGFFDFLVTRVPEAQGATGNRSGTPGDIKFNNTIHEFLLWVLTEKLSAYNDDGHSVVPHEFHNPVPKRGQRGMGRNETLRTPLPYRYIRELRANLAQGRSFRDWVWAQQAISGGAGGGGDWFIVESSLLDQNDPDCVFRKRNTSGYEQRFLGYPPEVLEIWSPVRAVALYLKLELPLRTFQVRFLDSGEADTWLYASGKWVLNTSPLAHGTERRPSQRGVFHRSANESGAGFYINTNKTADINKDEGSKGYIIPWTHEPALYWLEKLRNWQGKYNPILAPTAWRDLEAKHFGAAPPHPSVLEERGASCFLFRHAAGLEADRRKPICAAQVDRLWYSLLVDLEQRCAANGETLDDGSPIHFIDPERELVSHFPLHSLRVSLITAYALEGGVPFPVLSKLIAGHERIIMTLYYTKAGKAHVTEVMAEAEKRIIENEAASYRRFLMEKSYQELEERFAFNSPDALQAAAQQRSAAGFMFEDKGICPVAGGLCDIGGDIQKECVTDPSKNQYAPVPGFPQERNCIRCRFFLTGPAFLPGLQAHFNWVAYKTAECAERLARLDGQMKILEDERMVCEERRVLFTKHADVERINRYYEEEAERANKLLLDFQAAIRLVERCIAIANSPDEGGIPLVSAGGVSDIQYALCETESEMHQLEVICENAVIYPEVDAGKAILRRSQILDTMLQMNGRRPMFFRLNQDQQLRVGNEVMKLIQARAGGIKSAMEFVECRRMLVDIGLLEEAMSVIRAEMEGVTFSEVIDMSRGVSLLVDQPPAQENAYDS